MSEKRFGIYDMFMAVMVGAVIALLSMILCAPLTGNSELVKQGAARYTVDPETGKVSLEFCACFKGDAPPPEGGGK